MAVNETIFSNGSFIDDGLSWPRSWQQSNGPNYASSLQLLPLLTVVGNLGIIVAFWKEPSLKVKASDLLVLSLSVVDFLQGLVFLPIFR